MSSDIDKPLPNDVTLTVRMLMSGKEVGSIIGKGGEIINNIRESSSAKIHITDGSCPERIITVTGTIDAIVKAFNMICKKLEDDGSSKDGQGSSSSNMTATVKIIVPASQCGSLIGKGGSKIKEIREVSGASVQVASETLPNSTERSVTISGSTESISQSIYQICLVMLDSPAKGGTIPYAPNKMGILGSQRGGSGRGSQSDASLAGILGLGGGGASALAALASLAGSQIRRDNDRGGHTHSHEMTIPNDLIGCVIGKGGSKIAEIRQFSGAMIRISKGEVDRDDHPERHITISGNAESVAVAKSLINLSIDMHKSRLEERERDGGSRESRDRDGRHSRYNGNTNGSDIGLAQLLGKPNALTTALTTLATLNGLSGIGSSLFGGANGIGGGGNVSGIHRSRGSHGGSSRGSRDDDRRDSKRSKFAPY